MSEQAQLHDRIQGAFLGALVGDALGVGPHWYYDVAQMRERYGEWIDEYVAPKDDWYHAGVRAGDVSQTGQVLAMLLESLAERGAYDQKDFCARLDNFVRTLDCTPQDGRYTDEAMRDVCSARRAGKGWDATGGTANTVEGAIRAIYLAARYAQDVATAKQAMAANIILTHRDPDVAAQSAAVGMMAWGFVHGHALADLPAVTRKALADAGQDEEVPVPFAGGAEHGGETLYGHMIDTLLLPQWSAAAAADPAVRIDPPVQSVQLFGLACPIYFELPAVLYLAARFPGDYEAVVLNCLNAGGNNMARTALAGGLMGAAVGLSGIPERWIRGLLHHETYLAQAKAVADAAVG